MSDTKVDKVKKVINCYVPVTACNFKCHYCYVGQTDGFKGEILPLQHSINDIVKALSKKRLGGTCLLNFCACGETLFAPYLIELVKLLLEEGHYCTIVTNGVMSKRFDEILKYSDEALSRLFIKFSYHYLQLKEKNLLDTFYKNVSKIKNSPASFTVELTANDETIPYIDELKKSCAENLGALCHIIESRDMNNELKRLTKLPLEEHLKVWNSFDTPLIKFQESTYEIKRKEFCYAGDWALTLNLDTGDLGYCLGYGKKITNIFDNIEKPLTLCAIGCNCPWEHCWSSYFVMTNGVIPELKTPYYCDLRDRQCNDGSFWLKNPVNKFFHTKLLETNHEYTSNKKKFVNQLQAILWNTEYNTEYNTELMEIIESELLKKNISTIYLYNQDKLSEWLINLMKTSKIKVKYLKRETIFQKLKFYCSFFPKNIVVTDYANFDKITKKYNRYNQKFISIFNLI